jgi:hypothetical protein
MYFDNRGNPTMTIYKKRFELYLLGFIFYSPLKMLKQNIRFCRKSASLIFKLEASKHWMAGKSVKYSPNSDIYRGGTLCPFPPPPHPTLLSNSKTPTLFRVKQRPNKEFYQKSLSNLFLFEIAK